MTGENLNDQEGMRTLITMVEQIRSSPELSATYAKVTSTLLEEPAVLELARQVSASLQRLIDEKFLEDCPHCHGTGRTRRPVQR